MKAIGRAAYQITADTPTDADRAAVETLLGRPPMGAYTIVVRRSEDREPVVIRNEPHLDHGTPMPTRYWLVGGRERAGVGRLESRGGVRLAEAEIDPDALIDAHDRYEAERSTAIRRTDLPPPKGGVGGTRRGVKCLHAHYAWWLAGGDDPIGQWVADRLAETDHER